MIRVHYCVRSADEAGELRHPQAVMAELGEQFPHFEVMRATAHPIGDCWIFDLMVPRYREPPTERMPPQLPPFITRLDEPTGSPP